LNVKNQKHIDTDIGIKHRRYTTSYITSSGLTGPNVTKLYTMQRNSFYWTVWNRNCAIPIHFWMAAWQRRLVRKKRRFFDFNWLPWQHPLRNQKTLNEVNHPLYPSTNPEILVTIGPLASQNYMLKSRRLKNTFKKLKCVAKPTV